MRSFPGNPDDGHTLCPAPGQVAILTDQRPDLAVVDRGCRCHGEDRTRVLISGTRRGLTPQADRRPPPPQRHRRRDRPHENRRTPVTQPPERQHRRRHSCRALRLRPQHPKDSGPPQGLVCPDFRHPMGRREWPRSKMSDRHNSLNSSFSANQIRSVKRLTGAAVSRMSTVRRYNLAGSSSDPQPGREQPYRSSSPRSGRMQHGERRPGTRLTGCAGRHGTAL